LAVSPEKNGLKINKAFVTEWVVKGLIPGSNEIQYFKPTCSLVIRASAY